MAKTTSGSLKDGPGPNPPPDKYTLFSIDGLSSAEVTAHLQAVAEQGYTSSAVYVPCSDGNFVFVGGYSK